MSCTTRSGAEVSNQLKYFAERLPATFVYAGIDAEVQGLFAGVRGRQIAGRFTVVPAAPFAYTPPPNASGGGRCSPLWNPCCACTPTAPATWCALTKTSTAAAAA